MATKTTGAEWKRFYLDSEAWPVGSFHDDEVFTVCDKRVESASDLATVPDYAIVTIDGGSFYMKGSTLPKSTLEEHFLQWRQKQEVVFLSVETPVGVRDSVCAAIIAAGGKIHAGT